MGSRNLKSSNPVILFVAVTWKVLNQYCLFSHWSQPLRMRVRFTLPC